MSRQSRREHDQRMLEAEMEAERNYNPDIRCSGCGFGLDPSKDGETCPVCGEEWCQ